MARTDVLQQYEDAKIAYRLSATGCDEELDAAVEELIETERQRVKPKYIFVSGPYTNPDPVQNVRRAILAGDRLREAGYIPFVPHLDLLWNMLVPHGIDYWLEWDKAWIQKCDALVRLDGYSPGGDEEVRYAEELGLPVYEGVDALVRQR